MKLEIEKILTWYNFEFCASIFQLGKKKLSAINCKHIFYNLFETPRTVEERGCGVPETRRRESFSCRGHIRACRIYNTVYPRACLFPYNLNVPLSVHKLIRYLSQRSYISASDILSQTVLRCSTKRPIRYMNQQFKTRTLDF